MPDPIPQMVVLTLRIPRSEIGFLRFVLEAYDGLAQLSAEAGREEATMMVPTSRRDEALALLKALRDEIPVELLRESTA